MRSKAAESEALVVMDVLILIFVLEILIANIPKNLAVVTCMFELCIYTLAKQRIDSEVNDETAAHLLILWANINEDSVWRMILEISLEIYSMHGSMEGI